MADYSIFTKCASDWEVTSYGDFGAYAGVGGKIAHMKFRSPILKTSMHTAFVMGGVGVGVEFKLSLFTQLMKAVENIWKSAKSAQAEKNYTKLICHRPFSLDDIDQANAGTAETAFVVAFGYAVGVVHASASSRGPCKGAFIFSIPASVDADYGLKMEAAASGGYFLGLNNKYGAMMADDRWEREKSRKASDPLIRPAGGF